MSRVKKPPIVLKPEEQLSIGSRIQYFRLSYSPCGTKRPQTRRELSALANIQSCTLKEIEEGIREPRPDSLKRIKVALGCRMWMLTGPIERFVGAVEAMKLEAHLTVVWTANPDKDRGGDAGAAWATGLARERSAEGGWL
jgi:transcriptional regulator with XRE-family HTH domain